MDWLNDSNGTYMGHTDIPNVETSASCKASLDGRGPSQVPQRIDGGTFATVIDRCLFPS
jgi:hypothetical protein